MKLNKLTIVFTLLTSMVFAQKSDVGNWLMYFGNQRINKDWNFHNEIQYRSYDFITDYNQLILRTGIGYNLTENNNNILLGYGFINTRKYLPNSSDKTHTNEHRIFQQFITRQSFSRLFIQHRYRIEERFMANDFQLRFRYSLSVNIPINKKTMDKNTLYFSASNEIFIDTEKPLFDRNRLYGAFGYVISKNIRIEAGFMAQTLEIVNRNQFQIALFNTIPFKNN